MPGWIRRMQCLQPSPLPVRNCIVRILTGHLFMSCIGMRLQSDSGEKSDDGSAAQTASEASGSGSDSEDSGQDDAGPSRGPLQAHMAGGLVRRGGRSGIKRKQHPKHIDLGNNSDDDAAARMGSAAEASASGALRHDPVEPV